MSIFLSRYSDNIDRKSGAFSLVSYKNAISRRSSFQGIIAYLFFKNKSIEFCTINHLKQINRMIKSFGSYSSQRQAF